MVLKNIDWVIIIAFLIVLTTIGLITSRKGGKDTESFFLSGRNMPWWLLGVSMVATTFSIATPNLITDMVRVGGVARNWLWWSFLLSGMLTVFVYAKLWSRSKILTDLGFYEIRYSGRAASVLRGFRAVYLGFFINILILAGASLAFIKVTVIMTDINPLTALIAVSLIVLLYSTLGGLKSILWTDFFLFIFAMFGTIFPAFKVINSQKIGGLENFLNNDALQGKLNLLPDFSDPMLAVTVFIIPLTVQWWASWYPGSEPGGGGFIAQRMLAAKSEKHSVGATLFFNFMHYAIRPWPWILVALGSLIIFPDISSIITSYPNVPEKYIQNDIAYPIMLREFLPNGILGIVLASLVAAYMSTISTQINWGASYLVNDFYAKFIKPTASEKEKVLAGRLWTIALLFFSILLALFIENALQAFQYMLMIGAGTGLIYLLRWFWWRINAWSELSAMIGIFVFSIISIVVEKLFLIRLDHNNVMIYGMEMDLAFWDAMKFVVIVFLNTIVWVVVTLLTQPSDEKVLISFYMLTRPGGPGWKKISDKISAQSKDSKKDYNLAIGLACASLGCLTVFALLFAIGQLIYGNLVYFIIMMIISFVSLYFIFRFWGRLFN